MTVKAPGKHKAKKSVDHRAKKSADHHDTNVHENVAAESKEPASEDKKRASPRGFKAWLISFVAVVAAFAVGPIAGFYASKFAKSTFDDFYTAMMNAVQEEMGKEIIPSQNPDGTIGQFDFGAIVAQSGIRVRVWTLSATRT